MFKPERIKTVCPPFTGRARTPVRSKKEFFVTLVNSQKPLIVFRKNLILDVT